MAGWPLFISTWHLGQVGAPGGRREVQCGHSASASQPSSRPAHNRPAEAPYPENNRSNAHVVTIQGVEAALGATSERNGPRNLSMQRSVRETSANGRPRAAGRRGAAPRGDGGAVAR